MKFRLYEGRRTVPHTKAEMGVPIKEPEAEPEAPAEEQSPVVLKTLDVCVEFGYNDDKTYQIFGSAETLNDHWTINLEEPVSIFEDKLNTFPRFFNYNNMRNFCAVYFGDFDNKIFWEGKTTVQPRYPGQLDFDVFHLLNNVTEELENTCYPPNGTRDLRIISDGSGNFKPDSLILFIVDSFIDYMEQEDPELLKKCCHIKKEK